MKQLILFLLCLSTWTAQAKIYNVKDYGAKADGTTIDTPAINRAIEEAASQGGGTIYFPAGEYACYSIRLASHIHLYIEQGAQIVGAFPSATEGYDLAEPNEHTQFQAQSLEELTYLGNRSGRHHHQRTGTDLWQRTHP